MLRSLLQQRWRTVLLYELHLLRGAHVTVNATENLISRDSSTQEVQTSKASKFHGVAGYFFSPDVHCVMTLLYRKNYSCNE